jgi:anti-anti-sigma regulatory factor
MNKPQKKTQLEEIKHLVNASVALIREQDLNRIAQIVAEAVVRHTTFQRSVVSLLEKDGTFRRAGFGGLTEEQIKKLRELPPTTLEERSKNLRKEFLISQSYYIPHDKADLSGLKSEQAYDGSAEWHPDDFLFIPLYNPEGDMVGIISVDDPRDGKRPTPLSLLPMELLANMTAVAVENATNLAKLEEMLRKLREQQNVVMELSTPVIRIWEKILVLPLIGTVDSIRAQQIMENILLKISETESSVIIIDITGVPIIDTLVASHLIKTVEAVKLLGADTIITGINPEIAQTLVHLGVDLKEIVTKANLSRGIEVALRMTNNRIEKIT